MRGWLVDTNVVSELRKPRPEPAVVTFVEARPANQLFTSDVTFAEIRFGIASIADPARRIDLESWVDGVLRPLFAGRTLAVSEDVLLRWKAMVVAGQKRGHTFGQPDLFVAAIAALHRLVVVTRDTRHFVVAGVPVLDPWSGSLYVAPDQVLPVSAAVTLAEVTAALRRGERNP